MHGKEKLYKINLPLNTKKIMPELFNVTKLAKIRRTVTPKALNNVQIFLIDLHVSPFPQLYLNPSQSNGLTYLLWKADEQ